MSQDLLVEVQDAVGILTLNRPDKMNAFTSDMLWGLIAALDDFERRDDVSVVVLTGTGRGFCSGGDIGGMGEGHEARPHMTKERIWREIQAFPKRLARFEKPILCAVNGAAVGGGMDLALACDIRIAGKSAKFAETYSKIGLAPGGGGAYFLPRLIGKAQSGETGSSQGSTQARWAASPPGTASMARPMLSVNRSQVPQTITAMMRMLTTGSIQESPVVMMASPATTTPTDTAASAAMCKNAPRTLASL